ncbi:MAG: hydratase [Eubacteriales bacterium]|nr:hydratase [Eubacteriales bacterium]
MIKLIEQPVYLWDEQTISTQPPEAAGDGRNATMAWKVLSAHNSGSEQQLRLTFDALASHDITYVGIVQTARSSGLTSFPMPYVLTNCHNTLCAVGGTINEDDHQFGLSAAQKYGGIFVPGHQAVIHQYMREKHAACGAMILGSDSHTRYGALGTLAVGEGGPELVKQLLKRTYDVKRPDVVLIWLTGAPVNGVGPQDVALAIVKAVFANGFVKNKIMEFAGPGITGLSVDFRSGIDVMTTETTCLSSIWATDDKVRQWYALHGREEEYRPMKPGLPAQYDAAVVVDLSAIRPMIALPFHPSNAYTIDEFHANAEDILYDVEQNAQKAMEAPGLAYDLRSKLKDGRLYVDQGVIAGCSGGTFENVSIAARMLQGGGTGNGAFGLSVYPASQPIFLELSKNGDLAALMQSGVVVRSAFCGPCFGAGDVPAHQGLSIRHTTRNFPNREGSKPGNGQVAAVALMDARSITATALNGGRLTAATEMDVPEAAAYHYDNAPYRHRVYNGYGRPQPDVELKLGPNIVDWPAMQPLPENLVLEVVSVIRDAVTTTDELIPSGETSSYRSNPLGLAEFTLSRKDPAYVGRSKAVRAKQEALLAGESEELLAKLSAVTGMSLTAQNTGIGSTIFANKPGDGSAREQAASCQKVLGGWANLALEYATKRYRSNLVNWGMLPFIVTPALAEKLQVGSTLVIGGIRAALNDAREEIQATLLQGDDVQTVTLQLPAADSERPILLAGCLMNYYAEK